jgi:hypothetical protein
MNYPDEDIKELQQTMITDKSLRKPPGRPKKSSPYSKSDPILLEEMRTLIRSGKAGNPHDAASQVASKAPQRNLKFESIVKRLRRKYAVLDINRH